MSFLGRLGEDIATGGLAEIPRAYHSLKGEMTPPQQPGVGGPIDPAKQATGNVPLTVQDPTTGYYYDPATGTTYQDKEGKVPITDPNVAQQVAANYQIAQKYRESLSEYTTQQRDALAGQKDLVATLNDTIHNPNASSVAQQQLGAGADAIARGQLSAAAGATGPSAFLARRNATANIGASQSALNQTQGLVRANEVAAATNQVGGALNSMQTGARGMYDSTGTLAKDYSALAESGQEADQGLNAKADQTGAQNTKDLLGAGFQAAGTILGSGGLKSDERIKHDVHRESPGTIGEFLSSIAPTAFEYNGETQPRHGLLTSDVERSKIGHDLVVDRGGIKEIPLDQGLGAALMAVGHLHRRLKALEGSHGRRV